MQEGIVVGCDQNQEWLLPWWWKHYSSFNSYPVLFVDFGMSSEAKSWCQERGIYEPLKSFEAFCEKPISEEKAQKWNGYVSSILSFRTVLFKKPFALLQTSFPFTIWLDLDCQVLGSLEALFRSLHMGIDLMARRNRGNHEAHQREQQLLLPQEESYNSGVIAFRKSGPAIQSWVNEILERNDQFITDEQALSRVISKKKLALMELPPIYNWNPLYGPNDQAIVIHYQGSFLKQELLSNSYTLPFIQKQLYP